MGICATNNIIIGGNLLPHKNMNKSMLTSTENKYIDQADHIALDRKFRRRMIDVRAIKGADMRSNHTLVKAKLKNCSGLKTQEGFDG